MIYKIKVCDRFNTIEWETETPTTEECQKMYDILKDMKIKEEAPVVKKTIKKETVQVPKKPATDKQLLLLRQKKIPYNEDITAQQAYLLLQKHSDVIPDKTIS